ncbi:uncharacterized protein LOC120647659 [Panicum virgatum]|uniref:Man1/Src1-like C-terminal domain-containing protein n=1 Tax=Panicum virgatum TaxID=38727 RepID=A0A8T0P5I7_PANVG|nr:uncharacterized protein LOC120647659 [Panicum virgatum]KAG2555452.1 hypothetical protein PVAP13_9KG248200 [Panicum virgatum]KAG2555453.1 hypothetical protein PVAP13_9KG248200 [Panicum virgatum]
MPSRSPRRPGPLPPSASSRRRGAAEPPPGLFPAREDLLRLLAVLTIASAAAAACSRLNRRPEPFCDSVQSPDDYADDSCQPCPHNGRCVDGQLECVQGFKRYGGSCIEDGLLSQTATKISELLQLRICDQHARALCGQPTKILFQKHDVSDTVDELLSKNPAGLTEDAIQLVKARVLDTAQGFFETTFTSNQAEAFKCPELVAERYMPLTCQVRQWISRNIIFVASFSILFAALLRGLCTIYWRQALSNRAEEIYEQVCEILEDNAVNAKIGNSDCEPWVVASWLRDHLLVPRERKNASLWKKVEELILEDSRIDQYPKVIKGESKVVYEWQAGGSLSGKTKKVQESESRTAVGAIKLAEEMGTCVGEVREQGSCDPARRDRTKA